MSQQDEPFTIAFGSDLQEPVDLMSLFARELQGGSLDFVFGQRENRDDPFLDRNFSRIFWWLNKKFVFPDCPPGGFDVFGCNQVARNALVGLVEHRTNITSQMLWLGFRRKFIPFHRLSRFDGKSTWSFRKKLGLFVDSFTSFTSAPLKAGIFLVLSGVLGLLLCNRYSVTGDLVFAANLGSLVLGLGLTWPYLIREVDHFNGRPTYVIRSVDKYN
jgi:dolichol-phosphate mannosyltransferase